MLEHKCSVYSNYKITPISLYEGKKTMKKHRLILSIYEGAESLLVS
jgi:hypothetical protein